jgi:DNA-binding MarR family transcriptional regulator
MDDEDKEHAKNYRTLRAQGKLVAEQDIVIEMMAAGGGWQCSKMKEWEISATLLQTKVLLLLDPRYPAYTTAKDIADTLGRSYASVRKLLLRMAQRGTIESEGQGGAGYRVRRITTEKGSQ